MNFFSFILIITAGLSVLPSGYTIAETCKGETKEGVKVGYWKCYYNSGSVSQEGNYEAGKKHGTWKLYHENGKVAGEGSFSLDKETGKWKFFDEEGNLMLEQDYGA